MTHMHEHTYDDAAAKPRKPYKDEDDMALFWLDFHDPDSGKFLGACVVPAEKENFIEAVQVSHHYKCNPGGQVAWIEVENLHRAPREYLTRLLNADEVVKLMAIIRRAKLT